LIELLTEEKIKSDDYLRIRWEFYDIWNKLFANKYQIDKVVFSKFGKFWLLGDFMSKLPLLKKLWLIPKFNGIVLNSDVILRSNQLWMARAWEYPWALLNSHISPDTKILDVGSGHSLFPLYLAQKSSNIDSVDTCERQMKILCPALADIVKLKVNYFVDDAVNLSAKDDTYDYVFCISVIEHLEEEVKEGKPVNEHKNKLDRMAIREFLRVIKPGGRVILTLDYASEDISQRSFHFDYIRDLIEEFRANLLKPLDKFDDIRFTKEKESEMRKLWAEFFPYEPEYPPCGSLGIVLTKE
jgi:SAM-dependent methyltransferase